MKLEKAIKHLEYSREDLKYWRNCYSENEKDKNSNLDVKLMAFGGTLREVRRKEYIEHINYAKQRIAKYERIVK